MIERESRPTANRAAPENPVTDYPNHSGLRSDHPCEPLTVEDRADLEVIEAAKARGFAIAVRCRRCNQWVVAAKSVALHLGPVCQKRENIA